MKTFFILYDLVGCEPDDYNQLNVDIDNAFDYSNPIQNSVWEVRANTIQDVKKKLNNIFLNGDNVIIIEPKECYKL